MTGLQTLPQEIQMQIWGLAFAEVYVDCPSDFCSYQYSAVTAGIQRKLREARSGGKRSNSSTDRLTKSPYILRYPCQVLIFNDWLSSFGLPHFLYQTGLNNVGVQINHTYTWKGRDFGADGNDLSPLLARATEKSQEECYSLMAKRANVAMLWSEELRDPKDESRLGLRLRYNTSWRK
jgi:hypothetical protein